MGDQDRDPAPADATSGPRPEPPPRGDPGPPDDARSHRRAVVLVAGQILSLQLGAVVAKPLIAQVGGAATAALRITFAAGVLWLIARPRLRDLRRRDLPLVAALGVVVAGMNTCFFEAIHRLPLGVATTVEFLGPLTVVLVAARRPLDVVWGTTAAAGVALLTWNSSNIDPVGLVFAALAAACRALYILCSQAIGRRWHNSHGLCFALLVGAGLALPAGLRLTGTAMLEPGVLFTGLQVAVLSSAIPYALDMVALRRLPARTFGVLISLSPAAAALFGRVLLGQHLGPAQLGGIVLVVMASTGAMRLLQARQAPSKPQ